MALSFLRNIPILGSLISKEVKTSPKPEVSKQAAITDEGLKPLFVLAIPASFSIEEFIGIKNNLKKYNERDLRIQRDPKLNNIKLFILKSDSLSKRHLDLAFDEAFLKNNYSFIEIKNLKNLPTKINELISKGYKKFNSQAKELKRDQLKDLSLSNLNNLKAQGIHICDDKCTHGNGITTQQEVQEFLEGNEYQNNQEITQNQDLTKQQKNDLKQKLQELQNLKTELESQEQRRLEIEKEGKCGDEVYKTGNNLALITINKNGNYQIYRTSYSNGQISIRDQNGSVKTRSYLDWHDEHLHIKRLSSSELIVSTNYYIESFLNKEIERLSSSINNSNNNNVIITNKSSQFKELEAKYKLEREEEIKKTIKRMKDLYREIEISDSKKSTTGENIMTLLTGDNFFEINGLDRNTAHYDYQLDQAKNILNKQLENGGYGSVLGYLRNKVNDPIIHNNPKERINLSQDSNFLLNTFDIKSKDIDSRLIAKIEQSDLESLNKSRELSLEPINKNTYIVSQNGEKELIEIKQVAGFTLTGQFSSIDRKEQIENSEANRTILDTMEKFQEEELVAEESATEIIAPETNSSTEEPKEKINQTNS